MSEHQALRGQARNGEKDHANAHDKSHSRHCMTEGECFPAVSHQDLNTGKAYHCSLSDVSVPESGTLTATKFFPRSIGMEELCPSC
jgi:hypothetical protein